MDATPVGEPGENQVAVVFRDVLHKRKAEQALREREERQSFLLKLSDGLRAEPDADAVAYRALAMLSDHLRLDRCYITCYRPADDAADFPYQLGNDAVPPLPATVRLSDFPDAYQQVLEKTYVIDDDFERRGLSEAERANSTALEMRAMLAYTVRRGNKNPLASMVAVSSQPRHWTPGEIAPVEETAERTWTAIERARTEAALRDSDERFRTMADNAPVLIWETDRNGATAVNRHYTDFFGVGADEIVGMGWADFLHPDDVRGYIDAYAEAFRQRTAYVYECRFRRADGQWRWLRNTGGPVAEDRFVGCSLDVTDLLNAQKAMRESEERQTFLLELSDALRPLANPADIQGETTRLLREQLKAGWCYYVDWDLDGQFGRVLRDSTGEGLPSLAGPHDVADAPEFLHIQAAGTVLTVRDYAGYEQLPVRIRQNFAALGFRSMMAAPLVKDGLLIASLIVGDTDIRDWSDSETSLLVEVAERTWAAIERARAEAALRDSEERQRLTVELVPALLWSASPDGQDVVVNEGWSTYTGQSEPETQNYWWLDAVHPDDLPGTKAAFEHAFATGEQIERQQRIHKAGNGWRWHLVRHVPVRDARGAITRWFGAAVDIHETKLAEQALQETERRLQTLVEGVPQLVWRAVDGGRWTWASPQWTGYTGQAEGDSHGRGWLEPVHPDDREGVVAVWEGAVERGEFHADYRIRHAEEDRYRWFQTRATPVRDDAGQIIEWLDTSTDVDDLRQLQERQHVLVGELQHRTFNLMGMVRSMADSTVRSSGSLEEFMPKFRDRVDALARVQRLLSRLQEDDRVTFDELIRSEFEAVGALPDDDPRVTLAGPDGVALRSSTVQTFAMAVHELTTNAVKYGALGQSDARLAVEWHVEVGDEGEPWLHVSWQESGVAMPPAGAAPRGTGQGRSLIEGALPYQLHARTTYAMAPDGVRCTIALPVSARTKVEMPSAA